MQRLYSASKAAASQALPLIDRVRSYPTTIVIDKMGRVRRVHTGWTGPATGEEYSRLTAELTALVEEPAEMITTIATFISQAGVLDLSALGPGDNQVLVTGYDFLLDSAGRIAQRWQNLVGAGAVGDDLVDPAQGWGDTELLAGLCGDGGTPYPIASLNWLFNSPRSNLTDRLCRRVIWRGSLRPFRPGIVLCASSHQRWLM